MSRPKLVVFDLDGTLIDSSADLCHAVNACLAHAGRPPLASGLIQSFIGDGAATLVRRALVVSQKHPDQILHKDFDTILAFFLHYYREHMLDNTRPYEGVLDALHAIRSAAPEVLMAVLTNKPVNPSRQICAALELAPFFFQNYGGDSFPTKKPSPEGMLTLLGEAAQILQRQTPSGNLTGADVVLVGDSPIDVETARRCGVRSLGCTFGLAEEDLRLAAPDALVAHASEWPAALGFR